eukprot:1259198-Prymnesium_polylepis.4
MLSLRAAAAVVRTKRAVAQQRHRALPESVCALAGADCLCLLCPVCPPTSQCAGRYCSPGPGKHITPAKRLAIRRFTASVPVARCSTAGLSPRSSMPTYGPPLDFARLVCVA